MYLNNIKIESVENEEDLADIIEGLSFLISTYTGKYPMNRDFGINQDLLDEPLTTIKPLLGLEIKEKIEKFENRVEVTDVDFEYNSDTGALTPIISLALAEAEDDDEDEEIYDDEDIV